MKNALLAIACAALLTLGAAPRRKAPGAAPTLTIRDATGLTVTLTPPLTITTSEVQPPPPPPPSGVVITSVVAASGLPITSAAGGSLLWIKGSGFAAGGVVKVAGQAAAVIDWQNWAIEVKLPVVTSSQTGPVIVAPTGTNPGQSSFAFTILGSTLPPPPPPPPGQRVEFPKNSGWFWVDGMIPGWAPHGPTSNWSVRQP